MTTQRGFSLVELMVTVAVVAILAAIAYPSYRDYTQRSQRALAMGMLVRVADLLERNRSQTGSYEKDPATNKKIDLEKKAPLQGSKTLEKYYNFGSVLDDNAYTLTLEPKPKSSQADDPCGALSLTSAGVKTAKKGKELVLDCWKF